MEKQNNLILEASRDGKRLYLEGIVAQLNTLNANGRIYPSEVRASFEEYHKTRVLGNSAVGAYIHPGTDEEDLTIDRFVAAKIVEMDYSGDDITAKMLILNTPMGKIVRALVEDGVQLGASTRMAGETYPNGDGTETVLGGAILEGIDIVFNQSAPDAHMSPLYESKLKTVNRSIYSSKMGALNELVKHAHDLEELVQIMKLLKFRSYNMDKTKQNNLLEAIKIVGSALAHIEQELSILDIKEKPLGVDDDPMGTKEEPKDKPERMHEAIKKYHAGEDSGSKRMHEAIKKYHADKEGNDRGKKLRESFDKKFGKTDSKNEFKDKILEKKQAIKDAKRLNESNSNNLDDEVLAILKRNS